jgi:predicted DNA-binding ribbon-helix-helix protein
MKSSIAKRSVVIGGHKTSVSLEEPFWQAVRDITDTRAITVSELLREIDQARVNANLSSAVRVFVLDQFRQRAEAARDPQHGKITSPTLPSALPPSRIPVD